MISRGWRDLDASRCLAVPGEEAPDGDGRAGLTCERTQRSAAREPEADLLIGVPRARPHIADLCQAVAPPGSRAS